MSSKRTTSHSKAGPRSTSPEASRSDTSGSSKASSPEAHLKNQIDFQFLNFSHPSEAKTSGTRKAVRSHVTKQQHQKENAAAAARRAKPIPQAATEHDESSRGPSSRRKMTLDLPSRSIGTTSSTEGSPPSEIPSGANSPMYVPESRLDPATVYPEDWHPFLPRIMDHYLANLAVDIPDLDGPDSRGLLRSRFFPFVLTDPAPLHAVMLMATSHYNRVKGPQSHTIDTLQLRGMAIREINSALEDPRRATSDQLIAAVAKMASYEALYGDQQIFNTHMTGLLRMVSLRGGLPALGLDGLLERILLWIDSNAAHITGSHIYFDRAAFPSSARHPRPDPQRFAGGLSR